jgi:hypothetical protein
VLRYPNKKRIFDDCILAYGFPGQPYPDELLARGPGMAFKTKDAATKALKKSLEKRKTSGGAMSVMKYEILPIYLPWGKRP